MDSLLVILITYIVIAYAILIGSMIKVMWKNGISRRDLAETHFYAAAGMVSVAPVSLPCLLHYADTKRRKRNAKRGSNRTNARRSL